MFDNKSRYTKLTPYEVSDHRGRKVKVVPVPPAPDQEPLGRHLLQQGQRTDHLSKHYLDDPAGYWRICEINDAMLPEQLTEKQEIVIPAKNSLK
ncbi:MAG: hypothetical protein NTU98_00135 [Bacteroidetes bacterium]|nr:hypothetical protein [Bacteroidota bacterium]